MRIGVKYCGGCNPRYDRVQCVNDLIRDFPEFTFQYDTSVYCPLWLIICGCASSCCAADDLFAGRILRMNQQKDFYSIRNELRALLKNGVPELEPSKKVCFINETARISRTFTKKDVDDFAAVTHDTNGIHLNPGIAALTAFHEPIVHGQLVSGMLSALMGTDLPGPGTILTEEHVRYLNPVRIGDTITAAITLTSVEEHRNFYIGTFSGTCINQDGAEVVRGEFHEMMTRKLFTISKQESLEE